MTTSLWAHAFIHPVGLGPKEALSIAGLNWPPLVAKPFEEGRAWACKGTCSSKEKGGAGQCRVGGVEQLQSVLRYVAESVTNTAGK